MIAHRLIGQMNLSDEYKRRNFGAVMGDDFPQMAREIIQNKETAAKLGLAWVTETIRHNFQAITVLRDAKDGPEQMVQNHPEVAEQFLSFLYWGIQIGRELEKEQAEALSKLEA